jgi:Uma2 family endonuclease
MTLTKEQVHRRHCFTRDEVRFLVQSNLLHEGTIELIDGDIVEKMPKNEAHVLCNRRFTKFLTQVFGEDFVRSQEPIVLNTNNEPEPDVAVLTQPSDSYYGRGTPPASDVVLVIEVADATRDNDLRVKAPLYAQSGIPEYWVLDVARRELHVHTNPTPNGYQHVQVLPDTASVTVQNQTIVIAELLP